MFFYRLYSRLRLIRHPWLILGTFSPFFPSPWLDHILIYCNILFFLQAGYRDSQAIYRWRKTITLILSLDILQEFLKTYIIIISLGCGVIILFCLLFSPLMPNKIYSVIHLLSFLVMHSTSSCMKLSEKT
jgi:hypothetical protein